MNNFISLICILFSFVFYSITVTHAKNTHRVVDGDTIEISGTMHRLHGIDAPEFSQKCNKHNGGLWPCGKTATKKLIELIGNNDVVCDDRGSDDYGRIISVCKTNDADLNKTLVLLGLAWAFRKYSLDYVNEEEVAKKQKIGIWQAPTKTAEEYRKEKWSAAEQQVPDKCPIKGNITKSGKIYHTPWSPWYTKTKINTKKGERWFCNEKDALDAGWRAPIWGK